MACKWPLPKMEGKPLGGAEEKERQRDKGAEPVCYIERDFKKEAPEETVEIHELEVSLSPDQSVVVLGSKSSAGKQIRYHDGVAEKGTELHYSISSQGLNDCGSQAKVEEQQWRSQCLEQPLVGQLQLPLRLILLKSMYVAKYE
ncbi:hypothetical protein JD844_001297, partial [Phrynosoma platyrhinos]